MLIKCSYCGAPLDVQPSMLTVRCGYCGKTSNLQGLISPKAELLRQMGEVREPSEAEGTLGVIAALGIVIGIIGAVVYISVQHTPEQAGATPAASAQSKKYPAYWQCSDAKECEEGHICVGYSCKPLCKTNADCKRGGACFPVRDSETSKANVDTRVCAANCDLTDSAAVCGPSVSCVIVAARNETDCYGKMGTNVGGAPCSADTDICAPGYTCVSMVGQPGSCQRWCKVGQPDQCPSHQVCKPLNASIVRDGVTFGVCSAKSK